jgi:hypothetical protein
MLFRYPVTLLACVAVAGCGSFVPTVDLTKLSNEDLHKVRSIQIMDDNKLAEANYQILTVVEGHSCQNKTWDKPATRVGAIEQLKFHAWEYGANAISNIQCGGREGTSVHTNCWELVSCTAHALEVK